MPTDFRHIRPLDALACARIHTASYPPGQSTWDETAMKSLLALPTTRGLITNDASAFIMWQHGPEWAEILAIAVSPGARRSGIGRMLLDAAETAMRMDKLPRAVLDVAADNAAARALYDTAGYKHITTRAKYYSHGADAIVMEKVF